MFVAIGVVEVVGGEEVDDPAGSGPDPTLAPTSGSGGPAITMVDRGG
jgi:hypothetical protein